MRSVWARQMRALDGAAGAGGPARAALHRMSGGASAPADDDEQPGAAGVAAISQNGRPASEEGGGDAESDEAEAPATVEPPRPASRPRVRAAAGPPGILGRARPYRASMPLETSAGTASDDDSSDEDSDDDVPPPPVPADDPPASPGADFPGPAAHHAGPAAPQGSPTAESRLPPPASLTPTRAGTAAPVLPHRGPDAALSAAASDVESSLDRAGEALRLAADDALRTALVGLWRAASAPGPPGAAPPGAPTTEDAVERRLRLLLRSRPSSPGQSSRSDDPRSAWHGDAEERLTPHPGKAGAGGSPDGGAHGRAAAPGAEPAPAPAPAGYAEMHSRSRAAGAASYSVRAEAAPRLFDPASDSLRARSPPRRTTATPGANPSQRRRGGSRPWSSSLRG